MLLIAIILLIVVALVLAFVSTVRCKKKAQEKANKAKTFQSFADNPRYRLVQLAKLDLLAYALQYDFKGDGNWYYVSQKYPPRFSLDPTAAINSEKPAKTFNLGQDLIRREKYMYNEWEAV